VISTWLRLQTVFTGSGYQGMKAKGSWPISQAIDLLLQKQGINKSSLPNLSECNDSKMILGQ
jgi:hypothetical protein